MNSHCFVKVLKGRIFETRYAWPEEEGAEMIETKKDLYETDGVSYMSGR